MTKKELKTLVALGAGTLSRWIIRLVDWVGGEKR